MATAGVTCRARHPAPTGGLKLNVDAVFFVDSNQAGLGMVLRDGYGGFILARTVVKPGCQEVEVGEIMGFYEALSWLRAGFGGCCGRGGFEMFYLLHVVCIWCLWILVGVGIFLILILSLKLFLLDVMPINWLMSLHEFLEILGPTILG